MISETFCTSPPLTVSSSGCRRGPTSSAGKDAKIIDKNSQDVERIWPKEIELIRGWKETEVVGVVPVSKVRVMIAGGRRGADIAKGKKKSARGGRGSKKK